MSAKNVKKKKIDKNIHLRTPPPFFGHSKETGGARYAIAVPIAFLFCYHLHAKYGDSNVFTVSVLLFKEYAAPGEVG